MCHGERLKLFLAGDVMGGRGIDQILPYPVDPVLRERFVKDARDYVRLAERAFGPVPRPVSFSYPWGQALEALERAAPAVRIVNLETSITAGGEFWPVKSVHYRMHASNAALLTAARIDVCVLGNNHVMDFGREGLLDTLDTLERIGLRWAGAGRDIEEARRPARVDIEGGVLAVLSLGSTSSGIPRSWSASTSTPGVDLIDDLSPATLVAISARISALKQEGALVIASLHWGSNWGFEVSDDQIRFARGLIEAGADIVHGHSSHHVRPIEVYRGKLILYGCGDLLDDYEGISGYEEYRGDLCLLYLPVLSRGSGELMGLQMLPFRMRRMRLERAPDADAAWLAGKLEAISSSFGTGVAVAREGELVLKW